MSDLNFGANPKSVRSQAVQKKKARRSKASASARKEQGRAVFKFAAKKTKTKVTINNEDAINVTVTVGKSRLKFRRKMSVEINSEDLFMEELENASPAEANPNPLVEAMEASEPNNNDGKDSIEAKLEQMFELLSSSEFSSDYNLESDFNSDEALREFIITQAHDKALEDKLIATTDQDERLLEVYEQHLENKTQFQNVLAQSDHADRVLDAIANKEELSEFGTCWQCMLFISTVRCMHGCVFAGKATPVVDPGMDGDDEDEPHVMGADGDVQDDEVNWYSGSSVTSNKLPDVEGLDDEFSEAAMEEEDVQSDEVSDDVCGHADCQGMNCCIESELQCKYCNCKSSKCECDMGPVTSPSTTIEISSTDSSVVTLEGVIQIDGANSNSNSLSSSKESVEIYDTESFRSPLTDLGPDRRSEDGEGSSNDDQPEDL